MMELTVGELKRHLKGLGDDLKISFSGDLTFYRFKLWGDDEVILEFSEPEALLSQAFKRKNPNIKVAFIDCSNVEWDEADLIGGPIDVEVR